jgi:hypothetical protein
MAIETKNHFNSDRIKKMPGNRLSGIEIKIGVVKL